MKTSIGGRLWIKERESLRLEAYQDGGGVWTIGYGHTKTAKKGMMITAAQADALLAQDVYSKELAVLQYVTKPMAQCEFDALVSFAFNCGGDALNPAKCTAIRLLNQGNRRGFARNFARWNHDNGVYNEGLAMRRSDELYQFMGGAL